MDTAQKTIGHVCAVRAGYAARSRIEPDRRGTPVLQLSDIGRLGDIGADDLSRAQLGGRVDRYTLREGDLVFRSRGDRNTAHVISPRLAGRVVPLLPLMILEPDPERVLPGFLAWAINRPAAQRYFDREAQGSRMRMITRPMLETLPIPLPDLTTQRKMIALHDLAEREHDLALELAAKRHLLVQTLLNRTADGTVGAIA